MMYILTGIVFILVGLANYKFPEAACYIPDEWQFREVEVSEKCIKGVKMAGRVLTVLGIIMTILGLL